MGLSIEKTAISSIVTSKITSLLSICGSTSVLRDVYKYHQNKRYDERMPSSAWLVFSMSLADLGNSFFTHFLGPWLMPKDGGYPSAAGTENSCAAQAYLSSLFFASGALSNCFLGVTYWLIVCRIQSEHDLRTRKWRALLFGFPWILGLAWSVGSMHVNDPSDFYPDGGEFGRGWFCWSSFGAPGSAGFAAWGGVAASFSVVTTAVVVGSMACLVRFVYSTERRMAGHAFQGFEVNRWRTTQATQQGVLYTTAWLVVYVPQIVAVISMAVNNGSAERLPNWFVVFCACTCPSRGMLNAIVYWRPKVVALRRQEGISTLQACADMMGISLPTCSCLSENSIVGAYLAALRTSAPSLKRSKNNGPPSVVNTNDITHDNISDTAVWSATNRRGSGIPVIQGSSFRLAARGELAPTSFNDPGRRRSWMNEEELAGDDVIRSNAAAGRGVGGGGIVREKSLKNVKIIMDLEDGPESQRGSDELKGLELELKGLEANKEANKEGAGSTLTHITQRYRKNLTPSEISDEEYEHFLRFLFGDYDLN